MEERKQKLIAALEYERDWMVELYRKSPAEHNLAIEYLKTGEIKADVNKHELLDACINDLETMFLDYDCN